VFLVISRLSLTQAKACGYQNKRLQLPDTIFAKRLFEFYPALYDLMIIPVFFAFKAP
jgi:hypothetical protein